MAEESMKVVIGADVSQGINGINQFNKSLAKVKPGAAQATFALTNLSRVASDAPFGFIAIANNIEPLLQSFSSLSKEAGGTGGALKALGASMLGPAGIVVGFSIVSGLIQSQILKYGSLEAAIAAWITTNDAAAQSQREMNKAFAESVGKAQGEIAVINSLVKAARDESLSRDQRSEAVKKLNKEYEGYLPKLTIENINTAKVAQAVEDLTAALIRQAKVRGLQDLITKEYARQAELMDKVMRGNVETATSLEKALRFLGVAPGAGLGLVTKLNQRSADSFDESKKKLEAFKTALDDLIREDAIEKTLFQETPEKLKKVKEQLDAIRHARIIDLEDLAAAQRLLDIINGIRTPKKRAFEPGAAPEFSGLPTKEIIVKTQTDFEKAMDDLEATMEERLKALSVTLATGFGESLGAILGGADFGQAIGSFVGLVGDALISIGRIAIETGVALIKLKVALTSMFKSPGALIAVGVGLVALGSLIKTKIPKFAEGGIVTRPTLGLFGEAGPEAVIPLHKMNGLGGGTVNVQGEFRIRGRDLVAVVATGQRTLNSIT